MINNLFKKSLTISKIINVCVLKKEYIKIYKKVVSIISIDFYYNYNYNIFFYKKYM